MFCGKCGHQIKEGQKFCPYCGSQIRDNAGERDYRYEQNQYMGQQEYYVNQRDNMTSTGNGKVSFVQAVCLAFKNYTNFRGRASRREYWWFILFQILFYAVWGILTAICTAMFGVIDRTGSLAAGVGMIFRLIQGLVTLVLVIPGLSLSVRRLHDTGKAWYWLLIGLIPLVGSIVLLVFYCQSGVGENQWGSNPENSGSMYS